MAMHDIGLVLQSHGLTGTPELLRDIAHALDDTGGAAEKAGKKYEDHRNRLEKLDSSLANVKGSFDKLAGSIQGIGSLGMASVGFEKFALSIKDFNKQLYDLSRASRVTGQSFAQIKKGIEEVGKTTHLSDMEASKFFKTIQDNTVGIRMSAKETSELAQTLSREYGPALEDVSGALNELMSLQKKDIFVLQRMRQNMSTDELNEYAVGLMMVQKASAKEVETMMRASLQHRDGAKSITNEEKALRETADAVQELQKAGQNFLKDWGKPLAKTFSDVANAMAKLMTEFGGIAKNPAFPTIAKWVVLGGGALTAAKAVTGTIGGVSSMIMGSKDMFGNRQGGLAGLGGSLKGMFSNIQKPIPVFITGSAMGGGLTGAALGPGAGVQGTHGVAGKAGGFLGKAGMAVGGLAVGYLGSKAGEAVGGRGGAGISAASKIGGYALAGSILGPLGALGGAAIGVVTSLDELKVAFGFASDAADAAAEKTAEASKAQEDAINAEIEGVERLTKISMGTTAADKRAFASAAATKNVAKGQAEKLGLKGDEAEEEITKWFSTGGGKLADAMKKALKDESVLAAAEKLVKEKFGDKLGEAVTTGLASGMKAAGNIAIAKQFEQVQASVNQINHGLEITAELNKTQIELMTKYSDNVEGAVALAKDQVSIYQQQAANMGQMVQLAEKLQAAAGNRRKSMEEIKKDLQAMGVSEEEQLNRMAEIAVRQGLVTAAQKEQRSLQVKVAAASLEVGRVYQMRTQTAQQEVGLIESQLELSKALYMGLGPTLDLQLQGVQAIDNVIASMQQELSYQKQLLEQDKNNQTAKQAVFQLESQITQQKTKQLNLVKNLREGYLDALQAFTNVEGSFAKIITSKEMGAGEMIRKFKSPGGMRFGASGGLETPFAKWGEGGQLQYNMEGLTGEAQRRDPSIFQHQLLRAPISAVQNMTPGQSDYHAAVGMGEGGLKAGMPGVPIPSDPGIQEIVNKLPVPQQRVSEFQEGVYGGLKQAAQEGYLGKDAKGETKDAKAESKEDQAKRRKDVDQKVEDKKKVATEAEKKAESGKEESNAERMKRLACEAEAENVKKAKTWQGQAKQITDKMKDVDTTGIGGYKGVNLPSKKALGGLIPGTGSGDVVPSLLTPGEFVMTKEATEQHRGLLEAMNRNRFATGGPADLKEIIKANQLLIKGGVNPTSANLLHPGAGPLAETAKAATGLAPKNAAEAAQFAKTLPKAAEAAGATEVAATGGRMQKLLSGTKNFVKPTSPGSWNLRGGASKMALLELAIGGARGAMDPELRQKRHEESLGAADALGVKGGKHDVSGYAKNFLKYTNTAAVGEELSTAVMDSKGQGAGLSEMFSMLRGGKSLGLTGKGMTEKKLDVERQNREVRQMALQSRAKQKAPEWQAERKRIREQQREQQEKSQQEKAEKYIQGQMGPTGPKGTMGPPVPLADWSDSQYDVPAAEKLADIAMPKALDMSKLPAIGKGPKAFETKRGMAKTQQERLAAAQDRSKALEEHAAAVSGTSEQLGKRAAQAGERVGAITGKKADLESEIGVRQDAINNSVKKMATDYAKQEAAVAKKTILESQGVQLKTQMTEIDKQINDERKAWFPDDKKIARLQGEGVKIQDAIVRNQSEQEKTTKEISEGEKSLKAKAKDVLHARANVEAMVDKQAELEGELKVASETAAKAEEQAAAARTAEAKVKDDAAKASAEMAKIQGQQIEVAKKGIYTDKATQEAAEAGAGKLEEKLSKRYESEAGLGSASMFRGERTETPGELAARGTGISIPAGPIAREEWGSTPEGMMRRASAGIRSAEDMSTGGKQNIAQSLGRSETAGAFYEEQASKGFGTSMSKKDYLYQQRQAGAAGKSADALASRDNAARAAQKKIADRQAAYEASQSVNVDPKTGKLMEKKAPGQGDKTTNEDIKKTLEKTGKDSQKTAEDQKKATESVAKATAGTEQNTKAVKDEAQKVAGGDVHTDPIVSKICGNVAMAMGGKVLGFAGGGKIPGQGNSDSVPALLTPGEFVVNQKAAGQHADLLEALNSNRYARGGPVGPPADMARGGGGFNPKFAFNIRGDTARTIMNHVTKEVGAVLNDMMVPQGTSGRYADLPQSG